MPTSTPAVRELYFAVRRVKREHPAQESRAGLHAAAVHRPAAAARARVAARGDPPHGHHGGPGRPAAGARRAASRRQAPPTGAGQARAASGGPTCRSTPSKVLFCFKPHDEKSFHLYEMNLDGTRPAAAHRQRLRRHRPDLPARRPHPVHHHAGQHLRPLRAVHLLLHPGPLRRRRRQRLPDQLQRRAGLRARPAERRPGDLLPLGIHRQAALAPAEAVDHQPGRHRHGALLGQPVGLARPSLRAAADPRQPPRDVLRRGAPRLVVRLDRHRRPGPGPRLPARPDQGHRRPAAGRRSAPPPVGPAGSRRLPRLGPLHRLQDALSAFGRGFPRLGPRRRATSSAST